MSSGRVTPIFSENSFSERTSGTMTVSPVFTVRFCWISSIFFSCFFFCFIFPDRTNPPSSSKLFLYFFQLSFQNVLGFLDFFSPSKEGFVSQWFLWKRFPFWIILKRSWILIFWRPLGWAYHFEKKSLFEVFFENQYLLLVDFEEVYALDFEMIFVSADFTTWNHDFFGVFFLTFHWDFHLRAFSSQRDSEISWWETLF